MSLKSFNFIEFIFQSLIAFHFIFVKLYCYIYVFLNDYSNLPLTVKLYTSFKYTSIVLIFILYATLLPNILLGTIKVSDELSTKRNFFYPLKRRPVTLTLARDSKVKISLFQLNGTFYSQKTCTPYSRKGFNDLINFLVLPYPTKYYAPLGLD